MRTNCPASKASGAPSTRKVNRLSVQWRFSTTCVSSHWVMDGSLDRVWLQLQVLHLAAEHHDRALTPGVAGVEKLERVGAGDAQFPVMVTRQAQPGEGHRVIEKLKLIALARRTAGAHRALARLQAVGPKE